MDSWLVGRDAVLARARQVLAGSGEVVLEGPAGIGKTSVWQVLRAEAEAAGVLVLSAAPTDYGVLSGEVSTIDGCTQHTYSQYIYPQSVIPAMAQFEVAFIVRWKGDQ